MSRPDRDFDELVRRALHAAADSAQPADDGLDRIRARLTVPYPRPVATMVAGYCEVVSRARGGLQAVAAWPQADSDQASTRIPGPRRAQETLAAGLSREQDAGTPRRRPVPPDRPAWRRWLAPAACAVLVAVVAGGSMAVAHLMQGRQGPAWSRKLAATDRNEAAAWIAAQVGPSAVLGCDPAMCQALSRHGVPAGQLEKLPASLAGNVVVETPAVRRALGMRIVQVFGPRVTAGHARDATADYAPEIIASFGSGSARIDVRVIRPGGAAAYRAALARDVAVRRSAGRVLLETKQVRVAATARRQLLAGQVDARLLVTLADIAAIHPLAIVAFSDSGPGAGAAGPLRAVELTQTGHAIRAAEYLRDVRVLLQAQKPPYRSARLATLHRSGGQRLLRIQFQAPSPLGLLGPRL
jgi:hypothetical protein